MVYPKSLNRLLCCFSHVPEIPGTSSSPRRCSNPIVVDLFDSIPLPQDILVEILLLLPFKSVLDCKLVSKKLKNLIDDPKFSIAYTKNNPRSFILRFFNDNSLYILRIRQGEDKKKLNNVDGNPPFTMHRIPINIKIKNIDSRYYYYLLLGSSNGIACLRAIDHLVLYNLFTGAHTLTRVPEKKYCFQWACYGFGYDRYAGDHKIFIACKLGKFWVYGLRDNDCKSFEGFPYLAYDWTSREIARAYSFTGVLHWLVFTTLENPEEVIFTYDLHTGSFGEILVPLAGERDGTGLATTVSELNGKLCYSYQKWCAASSVVKFDVWVMKEYGIGDSWEKFISVDFCCSSTIGNLSVGRTPTMLYECGDGGKVVILAYFSASLLAWYDVGENKVGLKYVTENDWEAS